MATHIAIDAMGGDHAPDVVVEGAVRAAKGASEPLDLVLFGPQERLDATLDDYSDAVRSVNGGPLRIADAPEVIGMGEAPAAAVKQKQDSSIHRGLQAVASGEAEAFMSAGNTGAIMAAALFTLRCVPGVERPSVIAFIPTTEGFCILLDIGSNVDCKPAHLEQFARMGAVYVEQILGRDDPAVALLNVGHEAGKGNEQVKAAHRRLEGRSELNFRGNIEGGDLMTHAADVVVCDGFVGNILLKMGEAIGTTLLSQLVRRELNQLNLAPEQQQLVGRVMRGLRKPFDYEERGGVPLLGVAGNVLVGHGRTTARAVERMIGSAATMARQDVASAIGDAFE